VHGPIVSLSCVETQIVTAEDKKRTSWTPMRMSFELSGWRRLRAA
jgi:hypothetical protein